MKSLGPLTFTKDGKTTLYGVVSFVAEPTIQEDGVSKKTVDNDGMYVRVSTPDILEWINAFMNKNV